MATKEEQVETSKEQSEDQTSEEFEALSEEETTEKVSELLNEQTETTKEQSQEVEETEETPEEVEVPVKIIDEDFVKAYPKTKAYFGKPVEELGKGYESVVNEFHKKSQLLDEMKKKLAEATIPKLKDAPDPVDDPEGYKKWDKGREEAIRADERSKVVEQPPQVDYMSEVGKRLPADVDANKVIQAWTNDNAYRLFDKFGNWKQEVLYQYNNDPEVFYKEITNFYESDEKANKTDEEIRKAAHTKSKTDFKKARQTKKTMPKSEVHVVERESTVSEDEEQLQSLYKIVQEDNS